MSSRDVFKKDDDEVQLPFQGLDKSAVLQESRIFNDTSINARKCTYLITKILYILGQGETITPTEATEVFFNGTKLFSSNDVQLRRMLYIMFKELSKTAEQTFVAVNSLCKDMNSGNEVFQANAIRALQKITDVSMLGAIERHIKQAIVDRNNTVSSAAVVSALHIAMQSQDFVKRWVNEIQEALKRSHMVQYHALALLYKIRQHDKLAVSKLISSNLQTIRSPLAHCLLIKYALKVLKEDVSVGERTIYNYLESCLRHKNEMVMLEAARAITSLPRLTPKELSGAISVLQLFLGSTRHVQRFAAIRTLSQLAVSHASLVATCNVDMETLISDSNRNIATLAITTLLKTGSESSIDRLMKQIESFMSDIADEFKIVVVEAMKSLCFKYPQKYHTFLNFLSNALREDGGYTFKKAIIDTIITVLDQIPESRELGLLLLCEFIEDCEFPLLLQQILHYLGEECPKTSNPSKYIRYIYNRVLLEVEVVRASAVTTLAKFAAKVPHLRNSISVILKRVMNDNNDEVRDRATFYLHVLDSEDEDAIKTLIIDELAVPARLLENALLQHKPSEPFDISSIEVSDAAIEAASKASSSRAASTSTASVAASGSAGASRPAAAAAAEIEEDPYTTLFQNIPQLAKLGKPFKTSKHFELTEAETDYVVNCVKHIYADRIVFQFNCTNTVEGQRLDKVYVKMDLSQVDGVSQPEFIVQAPAITYQSTEACFVSVRRLDSTGFALGSCTTSLMFVAREVDASGEVSDDPGYEDEYQLEDLEIGIADYIRPVIISDYTAEWETLGEENQATETYGLATMKTVEAAVTNTVSFLGMKPANEIRVAPAAKSAVVFLTGMLPDKSKVLAKATFEETASKIITLNLVVRSENETARDLIANAMA